MRKKYNYLEHKRDTNRQLQSTYKHPRISSKRKRKQIKSSFMLCEFFLS